MKSIIYLGVGLISALATPALAGDNEAVAREARRNALAFCMATLPSDASYVERAACVDMQAEFRIGQTELRIGYLEGMGNDIVPVAAAQKQCNETAKTEFGIDNVAAMVCFLDAVAAIKAKEAAQ